MTWIIPARRGRGDDGVGGPGKLGLAPRTNRERAVEIIETDLVIIGGGGAGLRAAMAAAGAEPALRIALLSKVVPMRSHTVAAEGGSAGVIDSEDSLDKHFEDTVSGGDWLCEQDVVEYFVRHCTREMVQLEHWGCPWSRREDGSINVRNFGGMRWRLPPSPYTPGRGSRCCRSPCRRSAPGAILRVCQTRCCAVWPCQSGGWSRC
jgi:succinate dehydrogenase/fumarate reductase flavoprotein subunit